MFMSADKFLNGGRGSSLQEKEPQHMVSETLRKLVAAAGKQN